MQDYDFNFEVNKTNLTKGGGKITFYLCIWISDHVLEIVRKAFYFN